MRPLIYQKESAKVSVQPVTLNCVNDDKVFQIYLQNILLRLKCITQIMFCVVIAIPKGMSGELLLIVSSKSVSAAMSKLLI